VCTLQLFKPVRLCICSVCVCVFAAWCKGVGCGEDGDEVLLSPHCALHFTHVCMFVCEKVKYLYVYVFVVCVCVLACRYST